MSGTGRGPRVNPLVAGFFAGVFIAVVVGLMATINLQYGAPWADTKTLTAQVSDADSMAVGSDVRIAGRLVGQVVSIKAAGDHTNITFHVDGNDWPLPKDTTAQVRLATLLGQKYIQLNPGHSSQMLTDNSVIGLQSTKPVVDFDQILNTFDKPTRDALTELIRTAAAGVQGQEGTVQQLLPDLSYLSVHSTTPTGELVKRDPEFNNILVNLGVTADQLNASRNDLAGVIDSLNTVNAALASEDGKALKAFIVNTDTLNITTNAVLDNGSAATLDNALKQIPPFVTNLNTLLAHLIPQTKSFNTVPAGIEPSDIKNGTGGVPAKSALDLIYEIGSATSQGDAGTSVNGIYQGNFFLRQNVAGVDPCGLLSQICGLSSSGISIPGLPTGSTSGGTTCLPGTTICIPSLPGGGITLPGLGQLPPLPRPSICIPGLSCQQIPQPPACLPPLCGSLPVPVPTPCIPLPGVTCPAPTLPGAPTFSVPSLPSLPTPIPIPGISAIVSPHTGTTASDTVTTGSGAAAFPERYR
ncbi:MAG: MCE family protein [Candidatus Dormibacteraeota bacterium]|nr:MCE family protein [Candidatus Dormibacteraeota bacterium]MBV9525305.1 MCE family protein [Candidatus Dormibacteraeota bacterium]